VSAGVLFPYVERLHRSATKQVSLFQQPAPTQARLPVASFFQGKAGHLELR
jgi:hypothetical protein